jgi:hypothetical protein
MNPHQQLMIRNRNTIIQGLAAYNRRPFQIRHELFHCPSQTRLLMDMVR